MQLPYRIELYPAEEGGYVAAIPDLPGCVTQGETREEALKLLDDAKAAWIRTALDQAIEIPLPDSVTIAYSGKLNVRMPKSLHRALAREAEMEGVSLNSLIVYKLTRSVGGGNPLPIRKGVRHPLSPSSTP
ncbi:MAG: toxin-antitoxin system HicB family antitoxin [Firmicutes bacterium]|nr:toxin-antitoxin system HicB family antitoxin [Bacillota bacterium]